MALALGVNGNGIALLVSGGIVYEIIAKDVSSPQTVEINIRKRESTLMKWVHIGMVEGAVFVIIAATIDKKHRGPIIWGGLLAGLITELEYLHARASGLNKPGAETEEY